MQVLVSKFLNNIVYMLNIHQTKTFINSNKL